MHMESNPSTGFLPAVLGGWSVETCLWLPWLQVAKLVVTSVKIAKKQNVKPFIATKSVVKEFYILFTLLHDIAGYGGLNSTEIGCKGVFMVYIGFIACFIQVINTIYLVCLPFLQVADPTSVTLTNITNKQKARFVLFIVTNFKTTSV